MVIPSDTFQFVSAHCETGKAPDKISKTLSSLRISPIIDYPKQSALNVCAEKQLGLVGKYVTYIHTYVCIPGCMPHVWSTHGDQKRLQDPV